MRKLKLQVHISIDGFIAGPNGEADWIFNGGSQQPVIDIADTCDTIVLGRKTAQDFIPHWENVLAKRPNDKEQPLAQRMVNMRKIIFSHTGTNITGHNAEVASADLVTTVKALKTEPGKDIIAYGGAEFVSSLIENDLVDEYYLFTKPTALGAGLSIFKTRRDLKLINSVSFDNLSVLNVFVRA